MTTSPVKPADAKSLVISPTSDFCLGLIRWMLQGPVLFYKLVNYVFNADGTINNLFLQQVIPPGTLLESFSNATPTGYYLCNGAIKNRADEPDLFSAIGTIYGDGNSDDLTFTLPDCQGRTTIGVGTTQGLKDRDGGDLGGSTYALGDVVGEEKVALITAENAKHKHQMFGEDADNGTKVPNSTESVYRQNTGGEPSDYRMIAFPDDDTTPPTVGPTSLVGGDGTTDKTTEGKGTPHNNIQPSIVTFFYIKR